MQAEPMNDVTIDPITEQQTGLGALVAAVKTHHIARDYQNCVYDIFTAIGDRLLIDPRVTLPDAVLFVVNNIINRPPGMDPVVDMPAPLLTIFDYARDYTVKTDDDFAAFHGTMLQLVERYDSHLPYVKKQMGHMVLKENVMECIALNQAAEMWGETHGRQINFRISELN